MAAARKLTRYGHRDATMILIAYRHGLRASELCDLQWHQVELWPAACPPSQAGHAERAPYAGRRDTRTAAPTARAGPEPARLRLRARGPDEPQELRYTVRTPG